jgi:hypothetical protein
VGPSSLREEGNAKNLHANATFITYVWFFAVKQQTSVYLIPGCTGVLNKQESHHRKKWGLYSMQTGRSFSILPLSVSHIQHKIWNNKIKHKYCIFFCNMFFTSKENASWKSSQCRSSPYYLY